MENNSNCPNDSNKLFTLFSNLSDVELKEADREQPHYHNKVHQIKNDSKSNSHNFTNILYGKNYTQAAPSNSPRIRKFSFLRANHNVHYDEGTICFNQELSDDFEKNGNPPASDKFLFTLDKEMDTLDEKSISMLLEPICIICKEEFEENEKVNHIPCEHTFHNNCIKQWLKVRNTCPICRYEFSSDEFENEKII
jgi:hypothetical protein